MFGWRKSCKKLVVKLCYFLLHRGLALAVMRKCSRITWAYILFFENIRCYSRTVPMSRGKKYCAFGDLGTVPTGRLSILVLCLKISSRVVNWVSSALPSRDHPVWADLRSARWNM